MLPDILYRYHHRRKAAELPDSISLHYYWHDHNFGDMLNLPVIENLFRLKVKQGGGQG